MTRSTQLPTHSIVHFAVMTSQPVVLYSCVNCKVISGISGIGGGGGGGGREGGRERERERPI